jgi:uncharacterized membrane protein YkoI
LLLKSLKRFSSNAIFKHGKKFTMLRNIYVLLFMTVFAISAYAADGSQTITVIQNDGSSQSVDIAPKTSAKRSSVFVDQNKPMEIETLNVEQEDDTEDSASVTEDEVAEDLQVEAKSIAPSDTKEVEGVSLSEEVIPSNKNSLSEPSVEANARNENIKVKPSKKPDISRVAAEEQVSEATLSNGTRLDQSDNVAQSVGVISEGQALSIAIDSAPPSQDFEVFREMQGNIKIYQVLFKTGGGLYEVQIDAQSGDVIYSDYRRDLEHYSTPAGHLPKRLTP